MVSNDVRHGGGGELRLAVRDDAVRVEVTVLSSYGALRAQRNGRP
jgi:hypothetical protein